MEFLILIKGEIYANGFKVLSDEYSKPSLIILTCKGLPIALDFGKMVRLTPSVEEVPTRVGNFS